MRNLYDPVVKEEILQRIDHLKSTSQNFWGKMDVAQMEAHCSAALETACGQRTTPRLLIGYLLGPMFKAKYLDENPLAKNSPTDKSFVITDQRDFEKERMNLIRLVKQFSEGGPEKSTKSSHSFFGKLTPEEWSIGQYKHLDHPLRQFGV